MNGEDPDWRSGRGGGVGGGPIFLPAPGDPEGASTRLLGDGVALLGMLSEVLPCCLSAAFVWFPGRAIASRDRFSASATRAPTEPGAVGVSGRAGAFCFGSAPVPS